MGFIDVPWLAWLYVFISGVNTCIGSLMLKKSRIETHSDSLVDILWSPWVWGGMIFYGMNVLLFTKSLEELPVSRAYPVLAGTGFVMLIITSAWFFSERLSGYQYAGLLAVFFGIVLLAWN